MKWTPDYLLMTKNYIYAIVQAIDYDIGYAI